MHLRLMVLFVFFLIKKNISRNMDNSDDLYIELERQKKKNHTM